MGVFAQWCCIRLPNIDKVAMSLYNIKSIVIYTYSVYSVHELSERCLHACTLFIGRNETQLLHTDMYTLRIM